MVYDRCGTQGNGITGLGYTELCYSTDIACAQLRDLNGILTAQQIQIKTFLLCGVIDIVDGDVWY